jgi:hypothetical protein
LGYCRDSYYRFKKLYEQGGELALQEICRKKPIEKNRVEPHIEQAVVNMAYEFPAYGQHRVANQLRLQGIMVSGSGVRSIWLRHDLESFKKLRPSILVTYAHKIHTMLVILKGLGKYTNKRLLIPIQDWRLLKYIQRRTV